MRRPQPKEVSRAASGRRRTAPCHHGHVSEENGFDSWFLHEKLVLNLLPEHAAADLARRMPGPGHPLAQAMRVHLLESALTAYLENNDVASLEVEHLRGRLRSGQLVWLQQAIPFKGLGIALTAIQRGGNGRASFCARLATDKSVRVRGTYNAARLTCSTAQGELSGTKRQFILGYVRSVTATEIVLRPIAIAQRWLQPNPEIGNWYPVEPARVWPSSVDQFADVDFGQRLTKLDLNALKGVPEKDVKKAFADILGEPVVPKDWGGEQFDLWTSRVSVQGRPLSAAFAFKGPAKFHPMTIATLGKNGDQIDRLAQTAADLIVVQHCHSITAPVVNMLKAYASDPRNPRRYMTIDGYDTVTILRHFQHLK